MQRLASLAAFALITAYAGSVRADSNDARVHFEEGKRLRDAGDCEHAIPEFIKSLASEKSIGAYYNLGYCHEQRGARQDAYAAYKQALQLATSKHDDRTHELGAALQSLLETPHVRLGLPDPLPSGFELRVDDQRVPQEILDTEAVVFTKPLSSHAVAARAPGYETWHATLDSKAFKVIELHRARTTETPAADATSGSWGWQNWAGVGLGVAGAALIGVVTFWLIDYKANEIDLRNHFDDHDPLRVCPKPLQQACIDQSQSAQKAVLPQYAANESSAKRRAPTWITLGAAGVLLLGGGVYLFVTAPRASGPPSPSHGSLSVLPMLDASRAGVLASGTF